MKKIISVSPLEEKKVAVVFSDGISGIFDVAPYIRSDFFKRNRLAGWSGFWP